MAAAEVVEARDAVVPRLRYGHGPAEQLHPWYRLTGLPVEDCQLDRAPPRKARNGVGAARDDRKVKGWKENDPSLLAAYGRRPNRSRVCTLVVSEAGRV